MTIYHYSLGLHTSHDSSVCLVRNGEVRAAIETERLVRVKHSSGTSGLAEAVTYCLEIEGITLDDVDAIVVCDIGNLRGDTVFDEREFRITHHLAHAWAAVGLSPYQEAAVLVADGEGSYVGELSAEERAACVGAEPHDLEKESTYHFDGRSLRPVRKWVSSRGGGPFSGTDGIGAPYWFLSQWFFGKDNQESKVMGMAAYAEPDPRYDGILRNGTDGTVDVDPMWIFRLGHLRRQAGDACLDEYAALAAAVQRQTEEALLHRVRWLRGTTGSRNLAYAGGVALNCVANTRIAQESGFENVFVPFGPGDSTIAVGCALYGWHVLGGRAGEVPRAGGRPAHHSPYLGRAYGREERMAAVDEFVRHGLVRLLGELDYADIAAAIADGLIVGWFQGRSEFGPRALGGRSLLADPRDAQTRQRINDRVKFREPYRPFAPCVAAEHAADWFSDMVPGHRYMEFVARVRADRLATLPAITHQDGTARLQIIDRESAPALHRLLTAFGEVTGVPVLLNTSFNVGEPIVESPADALRTFVCSRIDRLVLGDLVTERTCGMTDGISSLTESEIDAARLIWHQPIEIRHRRIEGREEWALASTGGTEDYVDDGYHVSSYRSAHLPVSAHLGTALAAVPLDGVQHLRDVTGTDPDMIKEFEETVLRSRLATVVVPPGSIGDHPSAPTA